MLKIVLFIAFTGHILCGICDCLYLDKLIDELAKGKSMEKIKRYCYKCIYK